MDASAARQRNPRGAGSALRGDVVRAARGLLDETGSTSSVTLRAVARRVGIAAPSIYAHFDGPEQIVDAVVAAAFEQLQQRLEQARTEASSPRERLLSSCHAYVRFGADNAGVYAVLFGRRRAPGETPPELTEFLGYDAFDVLQHGVRACIEDGSSRATSVQGTSLQVWVALHGLVLLRTELPHFPWPNPLTMETELVSHVAQLR